MDYSISMEAGKGTSGINTDITQLAVERDNNKNSLANLAPGQMVTGTIISVGEQVTLDFNGQKILTSKEVFHNAVPGEKKIFEVVKSTGTEIELRLMEGNVKELRKIIKGIKVKDTDWESVLAQKEQKAKKSEKEKMTQEALIKLEEIGAKFTEQDYQVLEKEGFPVESMSINGLYEAINRIKTEQLKADPAENKRLTGTYKTVIDEEDLIKRLRDENLPITKQNVNRITKALFLSDAVTDLDDKAMKYLIANDAELSIENIYKAIYSGGAKLPEQKTELTAKEWSDLESQVKSVIEEAGYEVDSENISEARWLLENKLPLTVKTFDDKKQLEEIKSSTDTNVVLDRIMEGMRKGISPEDVTLAAQSTSSLQKIINDVNSIHTEAINYATRENLELNIKKLASIQADIASGKLTIDPADQTLKEKEEPNPETIAESLPEENSEGEKDSASRLEYEQIKARRQLEEIRLKMTLDAAGRLKQKGFQVETERLEKVVEELRRLEDSYDRKLLREAEADTSPAAIQTLRATTHTMEQLRYLPSAVLGATLTEGVSQTIPDLLNTGARLQAEYAKAGTAYETLATVPNSEYGDSIRKAFANMDSLLSEMKVENTEANQRAVRILGYNQMEISQENIDRVKIYDREVTSLIHNLHPAVTVRMIKEGINPLNVPIGELNSTIDRIKEEQGITSEDRFSNYLHRLEKENGITPEERKAYIGVYRLLYNVEKSDGAALGAVIKADQEVTLSHLLTAIQTSRKGKVAATIDDDFGLVTEISRNKESISEQLGSFTNASEEIRKENTDKESLVEQQIGYLNRILKQITEEISPQKLKQIQQDVLQAGNDPMSPQLGVQSLTVINTEEEKLWDTLKKLSPEKLLEQLQSGGEPEDTTGEQYAGRIQQIRELYKNSEQSLRFLNDYQMATSPQNIMIANHILSNGQSPIIKLLKRQNENNDENSENRLKELNEISDTLIDKSSMNEAFESLEAQAKEALMQACSRETLDSNKLAELRSIGQQMTFLRSMASREFYQIPIETSKGITNMNLTILRGSQKTGNVSVEVWSEELGNIKAEFSLKDQILKGFIACDNRNGLQKLQAQTAEIENAVKESNIILKQLDFGINGKEKDSYNYRNPLTEGQNTAAANDTERSLYRIAKAIVQTVRLAENSREEA